MHLKNTDTIQRFIFEHANIRGELVHLEHVYQTIISQRSYPPVIQRLLGEALVSCALLTSSIKFKGEVSLQFQSDTRFPLLMVQCTNQLKLRGFAQFKEALEDSAYEDAFLKGKMTLSILQDNKTQPYQSVVPIHSIQMNENIMHYFAQSEQVSTMLCLASNKHHAAGMLLQLMPEQNSEKREEFWSYAVHIGETIQNEELLTLDNEVLLNRLYHETELRLYPERLIQFECRCNRSKMEKAIQMLGEVDANNLLQEKGNITVTCDFCNQPHIFDGIDVALLFRK